MVSGAFRIYPCHMSGVEAVAAVTDHRFPRHFHAQYGFGIIERGAQKSASGRDLVEAGPDDVITVNPGEIHDGMPIGDHGRAWKMLYFDPVIMAKAMNDLSQGMAGDFEFSNPVVSDTRLAAPVRELFATATQADEPAAELRYDELLLSVLAAFDRDREIRCDARPAPIFLAKARIDDAPADLVTLATLARECGLSRFQVLRGFVKATGLTPHAYLMQRRLDLAKRLIAGRNSLADAAAASGFADQSHMTRLFVRNFGISPGLYAAAFA